MRRGIAVFCMLTLILSMFPGEPWARTLKVPAGTTVYCQLDEEVTSRKKDTSQGDIVRASVWRDVIVDGRVVVKAGTPVKAHVATVRSAKIAGVQGKLEIAADNVPLSDGHEMRLEGGYDKRGRGRKALSITLAAVVLAPLIFIKGKQAILQEGTVFDSYTMYDHEMQVPEGEGQRRVLKIPSGPTLSVEVLYDELERNEKASDLPMIVTLCTEEKTLPSLAIDTINGEKLAPVIALKRGDTERADDCLKARVTAPIKALGQRFRKGINTFEVAAEVNGERVGCEVVLEIEF